MNKVEIVHSGKRAKTDKLDARFLAYLDPFGPLIPSVYIPTISENVIVDCYASFVVSRRILAEVIIAS